MGAAMAQKSSVGAKGWATATLAGVAAGLIAAHLVPFSSSAVGASGTVAPAAQVDRTHKGDRLGIAYLPAPDARASGRTVLRDLMQRTRSQELREMCEPPASPYVDPQLAKLPGRCLS